MSENLPPAVKMQLDKANAIQTGLAAAKSEQTPVATPATPETPTTPATPATPETTTTPAPAPEETWEKRYKSFKGHADAELRRAHESVDQMRNENSELRNQLKAMQDQIDALAHPPAPEPEPPKGATQEDIEAFGVDQVAFTERVAVKAASDVVAVLNAKLNGLMSAFEEMRGQVSAVDERGSMTAEALFFKDLASVVPEYEELNAMLEWKDWLQQRDPMSGQIRQVLLRDAQSTLDVDRVAVMFNTFKKEFDLGDAAATDGTHARVQDLETQLSPPRSKTSPAAPTQPDLTDKIWTEAEITSVYDRWARGKLGAEEFKALEMEINAAVRTNRVR